MSLHDMGRDKTFRPMKTLLPKNRNRYRAEEKQEIGFSSVRRDEFYKYEFRTK